MIIYMNLHKFKYSYVAKNDEKFKQLVSTIILFHPKNFCAKLVL
jgi:hypothetical protein